MSTMKRLTGDMSGDILACLGCLATNKKLFYINDKTTQAYKYLTGMDVSSYDGIPQYICNYCGNLLLKYMTFRECCQNARYILHDAKMRDKMEQDIDVLIAQLLKSPAMSLQLQLQLQEITRDFLHQINLNLQFKQQQTNTRTLSIFDNCVIFDDLSHEPDISDDQYHNLIKCDISSPEYCKSDNLNISLDESSQKCDIIDRCDDHNIIMKNDTSPLEYDENDRKIFTHFIKIENPEMIDQELNKNAKNSCISVVNIEKINKNNKKSSKKCVKIKKSNTNKRKSTVKSKDIDTFVQKGKYFETKENMECFEKEYNVNIITLTKEQQLEDVLARKSTFNYLHSPYKCELCYKGFMEEDILTKHVSSQHDPSRGGVACEFCHFRYKDKRALTQHLRKHRLRLACQQCTYVSRTTFNAKEHHKTHGGHLYECKHCGKSYENISSHLSHIRLHHPAELMWCEICGEAFIGQFGLNAHKKRAHRDLSLPSQCPTCNKHFASPAALSNHARQSRDSCATCRDSCVHCGACFDDAMELRDHLMTVHRSSKVYACEKCDKRFSHETQYRAHYRRMHVESEEMASRKKARQWVCEVCGKACPTKCRLLYHQRNHTGEKPYKCMHCPKSFTMKRLLQSHLRVHTNDRPYECKLCPKTFKRLPALRNHEHTHTEGQVKKSRNRRIPT